MKILQVAVLLALLGLVSAALAFGAPTSGANDEPIDQCLPVLDNGDGVDQGSDDDIPVGEEPVESEFLSAQEDEPPMGGRRAP